MRLAVICMQKDEGKLLETWLRYHIHQVGATSIFLLDNGSTDAVTLAAIESAKSQGVFFQEAPNPDDFEGKGTLVTEIIRQQRSNFDWFIPLDCDEFLGVIDTEGTFSSSRDLLEAEFLRLSESGRPVGRVSKSYWNIPGTTGAYESEFIKTVVNASFDGVLDKGYHLYSWKEKSPTIDPSLIAATNICYLHLHNRAYPDLLRVAREKMKLRVASFKQSVLGKYRGDGAHLVGYFSLTPTSYLEKFPKASVDLASHFQSIGLDVPHSGAQQSLSAAEMSVLLDPVNVYAYRGKIAATVREIVRIREAMRDVNKYLEFGAGGTTLLACESGIQDVFTVETDIDFCASIIEKYDLRTYIDTGRLHLRHVDIGPTKEWGYPLTPPTQQQVLNYINMTEHAEDADLVLIDGRYRVACAAASYLRLSGSAFVLMHDYFSRPHYHIAEKLYRITDRVDDLAVMQKLPDCTTLAEQILADYALNPA